MADAISRASPRWPGRAANRVARSGEPETAEAGPLQHVADGIADTLNEGRETDGTKADGTDTDKAEADGDATNGTETARQPTDSLPAK